MRDLRKEQTMVRIVVHHIYMHAAAYLQTTFVTSSCVYSCCWPLFFFLSTIVQHTVFTRMSAAALIKFFAPQVQRLFKHCTRQFYFFHIFIQRYTFSLLIFLWTDTKFRVNLELQKKFTRWKKPESFMITRAKISVVRALEVRCLFTFLSQMWCLIKGNAYSTIYGSSLLFTKKLFFWLHFGAKKISFCYFWVRIFLKNLSFILEFSFKYTMVIRKICPELFLSQFLTHV